jgi:hypothetical protein
MATFKTTYNIFKKPWEDELWDDNWMNSDRVILPPRYDWDYARSLQLEDVDVWEVLYERGGGTGVYAAWCPYAEFYLVRPGWYQELKNGFELYYGPGAQEHVLRRAKELEIPLSLSKMWVEPEDMWLYQKPELKQNALILP